MWFISPNFEKLRRNLRKGILKGIYWIFIKTSSWYFIRFLRGFIERRFLLHALLKLQHSVRDFYATDSAAASPVEAVAVAAARARSGCTAA